MRMNAKKNERKFHFTPSLGLFILPITTLVLISIFTFFSLISDNDLGSTDDKNSSTSITSSNNKTDNDASDNSEPEAANSGNSDNKSSKTETNAKKSGASNSSQPKTSSNTSGPVNKGTKNSTPNSNNTRQKTTTTLKVGDSYMGGVIPSMSYLYTCGERTVCAWHLDGANYGAIYVTPKSGYTGPYTWAGRYLDIINNKLVTAEKDGWIPTDAGYYSNNLRNVFSDDPVEMAKKYNLRVVNNKKLYLTIGGKTYTFSPGYEVTGNFLRCSLNEKGTIRAKPDSQIDLDIKILSPSFYDPTNIKYMNRIARSNNPNIVDIISIKKKTSGVVTMTLKTGSYKYGKDHSTTIRYYYGCADIYIELKP